MGRRGPLLWMSGVECHFMSSRIVSIIDSKCKARQGSFRKSFKEKRRMLLRHLIFYSLWKVHKEKPSMRPVIARIPRLNAEITCARQRAYVYVISSDQLVNQDVDAAIVTRSARAGAKLFSICRCSWNVREYRYRAWHPSCKRLYGSIHIQID